MSLLVGTLAFLLSLILLGSWVYCILAAVAAWRYLQDRANTTKPATLPPISVLKPLSGDEPGLEDRLRAVFTQDYPDFEILFAARVEQDTAVPLVRRLQAEYPHIPSQLLLVGEPPYANAKVFSLDAMAKAARHSLFVMSDSDVWLSPRFLRGIAAEFERADVITCPYRSVPSDGLWSRLEALGHNTEFFQGVLTARLLDGMKFALGPTIAARREVLDQITFDHLKDYLAEDFVIGHRAAELGYRVLLSHQVIDHFIGGSHWRSNFSHRLRWNRSTRRSRPIGYLGQIFTNPLPIALLLLLLKPATLAIFIATLLFRALAAYMTADAVLKDPLCERYWWLIPAQDVLNFIFWLSAFFGTTILWRGRKYELLADGKFRLIS